MIGALVVGAFGAGWVLSRHPLSSHVSEEDAALASAARQRASGDGAGALKTLIDCALHDRDACRCADGLGELGIDLGQGERTWPLVIHATCAMTPRHGGAVAEAFVLKGNPDEAIHAAREALAKDPKEPHANLALAWALSESGSSPQAISAAETAVAGGRGIPALLLLGKLRSGAGDAAGALAALNQASHLDPKNARVQFDLGVAEQGAHHYNESREAYLKALAIDPKLADARYNLALLTHSAGANDEARHDLDELTAIAPNDPRIPGLRALLSAPAK